TGRGPGEADVRRFSTSAATPSAACYGLALAALRRDLRTPPPACQYYCCHSVGGVLRPRPRCAPARPPHAASCVSGGDDSQAARVTVGRDGLHGRRIRPRRQARSQPAERRVVGTGGRARQETPLCREELLELRVARRRDDDVGDLTQHSPAIVTSGGLPLGGEPSGEAGDDNQRRDDRDDGPGSTGQPPPDAGTVPVCRAGPPPFHGTGLTTRAAAR